MNINANLCILKDMRKPIVDGIFYPAQKDKLEAKVKELLDTAPLPAEGKKPSAIVVPHAGYNYTGELAAKGFKAVSDQNIRTVVLIAPVTRDAQDGLFLSDYTAFQTPMGEVSVDQEAVKALINHKGRFSVNNFPFLEEHSIEVQLPFIQYLWPEAKIVPVHMGRQNPGTVKQLSKALKEVFVPKMDNTLFVVSSNASPYLQRELAQEYAASYLSLCTAASYEAILKELQKRTPLPGGTGCAAAVLGLAEAAPRVTVLGASDSGGDKIVCYASLAVSF